MQSEFVCESPPAPLFSEYRGGSTGIFIPTVALILNAVSGVSLCETCAGPPARVVVMWAGGHTKKYMISEKAPRLSSV